jgi:hypothetical protein
MKSLNDLKNKILGKDEKYGPLVDIIDLSRELGCIGEILGKDFEVYDKNNNLVYRIRQKSISVDQLNTLLKELSNLRKRDQENSKKGVK